MSEEVKNNAVPIGDDAAEKVAGGVATVNAVCPICGAVNYVSIYTTACTCWRCGAYMTVQTTITIH